MTSRTFTMNCNRSWCLFTYRQKFRKNAIGRRTAVNKVQIKMLKITVDELIRIVHFLVQPNYRRDIMPPEIVEVKLGGMEWIAVEYPALAVRTAEAQKFIWYDPI